MDFKPRFTDLVSMLQNSIREHGPRPAFGVRNTGEQDGGQGAGWKWVTYREFGDLVDRARAGLASLGLSRGDCVAIISNNRLEWVVGQFAAFGLSVTWVPMYEQQHDEDRRFILEDCAAKVVIVANAAIRESVERMRPGLPAMRELIQLDGSGAGTWAALLASAPAPVPAAVPGEDDIATMVYTSGTTGFPKGVRLSHKNLAANISAAISDFPITAGERSLAFLPWAHVAGGSTELHSVLATGASTAICERVETILASLPEVQPTFLLAVPRIWNRIYDGVNKQIDEKPALVRAIFHRALAASSRQRRGEGIGVGDRLSLALARKLIFSKVIAKFGGRLKYAMSGAAALSPAVGEFIDTLGVKVFEGYGMTETSSAITINTPTHQRIGSVGKPVPGVRVELDTSVGEGGSGEIIVYGHAVMQGYHNRPDETKSVMTEDGGLRTGDLGRFDEDGFLFITGRVKEIYKLENGKYVSPAPLEEKITLSRYVLQAMVHGQDKPHNVALIVPDFSSLEPWAAASGISASREELCAHPKVRALIASELETYLADAKGFEAVRDFLLTTEEFTVANDLLTPSLKMKRRNVAKKYGAALDALYGRASHGRVA